MKIQARSTLIATLVLIGSALFMPGEVLAQPSVQPGLFALTAAAFPPGSHVIRADVESNRQLRADQPLHFELPPGASGRITGYYMDAEETAKAGQVPPYTSYLVSIFRSSQQAQSAFDVRWDIWFAATYYTTPPSVPVALGKQGSEALFHTLDPSQPPLSELFFRQGAILMEVFQGTDRGNPSAAQMQSFWDIAGKLDTIAGHHPRGQ